MKVFSLQGVGLFVDVLKESISSVDNASSELLCFSDEYSG
jgi:hypothetical protein